MENPHGGFVRKENDYEPDDESPLNEWLEKYKEFDYEYDTDEDVPMLSKNKNSEFSTITPSSTPRAADLQNFRNSSPGRHEIPQN
ncbi:hypothetical protein HUJ05_007520 [Dendroctonus ponderosae]|nr:hypothetical protein HUJ05_007520 [Dendroctonus ponderosae]